MLDVHIVDGGGTKRHLELTPEGAIKVAITSTVASPSGTPNFFAYYKPILGSTGANSGVTNQNVNGSVTPQIFYMSASPDYDIQVTNIVILITDGSISHQKFGALSALTNGWSLVVSDRGIDSYIIEGAKSNGELLVQAGAFNTFGAGTNLNIIPNYVGASDGLVVSIPVATFLPNGLRIGSGTTDRIFSIVRDNLTGLDGLYVYCIGYKHF